jgi:SseB protein N-terminal domain
VTGTSWQPANEAERRMADALSRQDTTAYFQVLATAPLYLPAPPDDQVEDEGRSVVSILVEGRRFLLAFASPEAAVTGVGPAADSLVATTYRELVENWTDADMGLALDPASPIGVITDLATVMEAALERVQVPTVPDDPGAADLDDPSPEAAVTRAIELAVDDNDPELMMDSLALATVFVPVARSPQETLIDQPGFPWRPTTVDDAPTILAFTTPERMAASQGDDPHIEVPLVDLALAWPDPDYQLVLDPGTATTITLTAEELTGLASWFDQLAQRHSAQRSDLS